MNKLLNRKKLNTENQSHIQSLLKLVCLIVTAIVVLVDVIRMPSLIEGGKILFNSIAYDIMEHDRKFVLTYDVEKQDYWGLFLFELTCLWIVFLLAMQMRKLRMHYIAVAVIGLLSIFYAIYGSLPIVLLICIMMTAICTDIKQVATIMIVVAISMISSHDVLVTKLGTLVAQAESETSTNIVEKPFDVVSQFIGTQIDAARFGCEHNRSLQTNVVTKLKKQQTMDNNQVALEVTMTHPASYYLKGFVGNEFDGHWEMTTAGKIVENADMFYWLHKVDLYGYNQLAVAAETFTDLVDRQNDDLTNQITVKNISANRKYCYLPYEYIDDNEKLVDELSLGDDVVLSPGISGAREYSYRAADNLVTKYPEILKNFGTQIEKNISDNSYITAESYYNSYVYETCTEVESEINNSIEEQFGKYDDNKHLGYSEAKQKVFDYVANNINANETDSVYATAATMVFRYYGIPARYVEGYIITPNDIEHLSGTSTIKVRQSAWHSWCEYYQDGVGFISFECAPDYIDVMGRAEDVIVNNPNIGSTPAHEIVDDNYLKKDQIDENQKDEKNKWNYNPILWLLVVSVLLVVYVKKIKPAIKSQRRLHSGDNNIAIREEFTRMMEIMYRKGICNNELSLDENAEMIKDTIDRNEFAIILKLYRKARFSGQKCSDDERRIMTDKSIHYINTIMKG